MNLNNISILENSLYATPTEREELVADTERVAKLFVTTFLGFIAMYGSGKVKSSLVSYLRSEQRVTLRNIGDDNNDLSLVIKLALEAGIIRIQQAREMTKLVYLLKKLSIDSVDEVAILNLMSPNIKIIKELDGRFKSQYSRYLSSEITIYEFIYNLRAQIRADESLSTEFKDIFIKYLPMLKKKAGAADDIDDDTDSPVVAQKDATNLVKSATPEDIEATKAAEDKVKDTAVADEYDLTNHDTLQKIFIDAVSGDAKSVLKSAGTTLTKFPWADVVISDDVAYAWYKNRSTTDIKDAYINRLRVTPYGRARFSGKTLPVRLTGDSLYLRGLEVALNRGLDPFKFFEETIQLWQTNGEAFDGLKKSFGAIQKKLGNKSYNFFLRVIDEGYGNIRDLGISTFYMLFSDPTEKYGISEKQANEYFIDNFDTFNTKEKETIIKLIITSDMGYRARGFDERFDERKRKYDNISASRESVIEEFGAVWNKLYNKLEENDFYNSDFIRSFEITTLKDLDPDTDPKNIYEYYKGQQIQLVSEENFSKLMQYVKTNNLETEWLKSLGSWSEIDNFVISNSPNTQVLNLSKLLGIVKSARSLTVKEYEFIIRAIVAHVVENNKSNIFKPHTISEFWRITENIISMFGNFVPGGVFRASSSLELSPKGVVIITDIFSKYEPMQVLIDIDDKHRAAFDYLVGNKVAAGSTTGFNYTTTLSPNVNIDNIIRGIVSFGIDPVVYGTISLSYSLTKDITALKDMRHYVREDSSVLDSVLGPNSQEKIVSGVLEEFIKNKDSIRIRARGFGYTDLLSAIDHLPSSYNDLVKDFFEVLDELDIAAEGKSIITASKEVLSMLITRGIVDVGTIGMSEINKLMYTSGNLQSELGEKLVARGLELEGDEFITNAVARFELNATNTSAFYNVVRENNPEKLGILEDALINSDSEAFISGFSDDSNDAYFKSGFVSYVVEAATPEFKEKFAKEALKRMTQLTPRKLGKLIKDSKDIVVTLLFNIDDETFDEIIDSDIPYARKRELSTAYITRKALEEVDFKADLFDSKQPIVPMTDLSNERLVQILEYNDIKIETKGIRKRKTETYSEYLNRVADESIDSFVLGDVKATDEELSEDMLTRRTVEYNKLYANNLHGDVALKFVRTLSASPELTRDTFQKFRDEHPDTSMIPVFHGTGSVAASMIMRKGFAIIDPSDASAVGRMLGNGIYFSNILDKSAQYIGDGGYSRGKGTRGYLLEMQATLGKEKIDYDSAGTGGDRIVSPEWVVYDPGNQLSIKKAHEVVLVSKAEIEKLAEMNDLSEEYKSDSVVPIKGFINWIKPIKESFNVDLDKYSCTFVFRDGTIPLRGKATPWRDISLPDNVHMESSALGTAITIYFDNPDIPLEDVYIVTNTREFIQEEGEVYKILTSIMNNDPLTY